MKITVIGGAGVRTVIFINGLLKRYQALNIDKVVLYDIDEEKLRIIGLLCKYVVKRGGEHLQVETAHTPEEALKDADYVVTTLRVGGDHARVIDEEIALKHGVIGQETTGAGGFSMAVRTIPVLQQYCKWIKEYAPDAWIFNFTNPSGLVTQALRMAEVHTNEGIEKLIGICDAPSSTKFRMAEYLKADEKDLYVEFFGLNHLSWISSVKLKGKEILGELLYDVSFLQGIQEFSVFDPVLLQETGYLPNEYLYYYYHREKALAHMLHTDMPRGKFIEETNIQMMEELKSMDIEQNPEEALQCFLYYMDKRERSYMQVETGRVGTQESVRASLPIPEGMGYAGVMLDCIEGLQSDTGRDLVLSVQNGTCIKGLAPEDVIEVTCRVSKKGIQPVNIPDIPEEILLWIQTIKKYEKLTIEAIQTKSKEKGRMALTIHPLVLSYSLAKNLLADYEKYYSGFLE